MIVTEAEAKRKWCSYALVPVVAVAGAPAVVANRKVGTADGGDGTKLSDARCFASNCMHWDWVEGDYASDADRPRRMRARLMHVDWSLTQPTKGLDYPDHLQPGRAVAAGGDGPACAACSLGRPCGARDCPNNPENRKVIQ